jgi:hypothetical protein
MRSPSSPVGSLAKARSPLGAGKLRFEELLRKNCQNATPFRRALLHFYRPVCPRPEIPGLDQCRVTDRFKFPCDPFRPGSIGRGVANEKNRGALRPR